MASKRAATTSGPSLKVLDASPVPITGGQAMWRRFEVAIPDSPRFRHDVRLVVSVEGRKPVLERVEMIRRKGGPPIEASDFPLPLATLLRAAWSLAVLRQSGPGRFGPGRAADVRAVERRVARPHGGRPPMPLDRLETVADVYRDALGRGENPTKAVEAALVTSRSNAGKLVQQARRHGFLGPAAPGMPGEEQPKKKAKRRRSR